MLGIEWALLGGKVLGFLKAVPREVWYILIAVAALWMSYHMGARGERSEWVAKLEAAQMEAEKNAVLARAAADEKAKERAEQFERKQDDLQEIIDEAEASGVNPIDALLSGLSEAD